jgi:hypothetical protein
LQRRKLMNTRLMATLVGLILAVWAMTAPARAGGEPDVVVIVDTSITMKKAGMDQERASLLLTKLLSDISPGRLAVIRLLDIKKDAALLPSKATGIREPCDEDPSRMCDVVEMDGDWGKKAREERLGVEERGQRGDPAFKKLLETHLAQVSGNSAFAFSFWAAKGVFDKHAAEGFAASSRTVIWLSDGKDESGDALGPSLDALRTDGVAIVTVIFGQGDPTIPQKNGLTVQRVSTPAELMNTLAQTFRGIVGAPYRVDGLVAARPELEMREHVEEAWVVVYGDKTLGNVSVSGPNGEFAADYAQDSWPAAGAYRVAHFDNPQAGSWRIRAEGGGSGVAYAVVQRLSLAPVLLEPAQATAQTQVRLVAGLQAKGATDFITDPEVLTGATMRIRVEGAELTATDDGSGADRTAGDGRFSVWHSFAGTGIVPVELQIDSPVVQRTAQAQVDVSGIFKYQGGPVSVDFGRHTAPRVVCRPLTLVAEHKGPVPFELERLKRPPGGFAFVLRAGSTELRPKGPAETLSPGIPLELCLKTTDRAPNSQVSDRPMLRLQVAGSKAADQQMELRLSWQVDGLTWWQLWGWLVLTLLGLLVAILIALGYILPKRFQRTLSLSFAPELEDVDETPPLALYTWRGVGIGFYRDARAFLHGDFRISGKGRGALASLHAEASGTRVCPGKGMGLFRQDFGSKWEELPKEGEMVRAGEIYRIGENGPYFRIASRVGGV